LEAAEQHPDREVRDRVARLLKIIRQQELERRYTAFRADLAGMADHGLAGWEAFRDRVGDGAEARNLFIDMHRVEKKLLAQGGAPKEMSSAIDERATEVQITLRVAPQQLGVGTAA